MCCLGLSPQLGSSSWWRMQGCAGLPWYKIIPTAACYSLFQGGDVLLFMWLLQARCFEFCHMEHMSFGSKIFSKECSSLIIRLVVAFILLWTQILIFQRIYFGVFFQIRRMYFALHPQQFYLMLISLFVISVQLLKDAK